TRFVVTSKTDPPLAIYDHYVDRGEPEQWIDQLKATCFADRLSCCDFWPNQFRLLLAAATYWLLDTVCSWLHRSHVAPMRLETLRLTTLKIGGRVSELVARVRSEEHTSELQSLRHLVCRLLLEKKKNSTTSLLCSSPSQ